jgi:hypothetical protein
MPDSRLCGKPYAVLAKTKNKKKAAAACKLRQLFCVYGT